MEIYKARYRHAFDMKMCNERNLQENYNLDFWRYILRQEHSSFILLYNNIVVGYILCNKKSVISFSIDKQHRKCGFGEKLLKSVLDDVDNVDLHVRESNDAAIQLYNKCGFVKKETIENYYTNPTENAFIMFYTH